MHNGNLYLLNDRRGIMDITKIYVDRCEKSFELQGLWKPEMGDWFHAEHTDWQIGQAGFAYEGEYDEVPRLMYDGRPIPYLIAELSAEGWLHEKLIWLPRQDQLQEMVKDTCDVVFCVANAVNDGVFRGQDLITLEQLWLAFVMREKYNKQWKDDTWKHI